MTQHNYTAYGLVLQSEVEIPELVAIDPADLDLQPTSHVRVRIGQVPDHLDDPIGCSDIHETTRDDLLLRIEGVADYLISRGSEITIQPAADSTAHEVRVFLLGSGLGALLHQRGFFVLHASGIAGQFGAAAFTGDSGAGKSTLLGELLRRGHRMAVDDVCAIRLDDHGHPVVIPSYPRTRVWADSAEHLDVDTTDLIRTRPMMEKFERQVPDQFWAEVAPLRRIYHLTIGAGDGLSLTKLGAIEAFPTLLRNTYRSILVDGFDLRRHHFDLASAITSHVGVVRVVRGTEGFRVSELVDLVLEDLELDHV